MLVLVLLPIGIALPVAVGYLTATPTWGLGVLLGELVAGVAYRPTRTPTFLILLLFSPLLLLRSPGAAREPARRCQCVNNLKQLGVALHNYHDAYKCFPPAYVADEEGRPMHSWRVLILPYLERVELYEKYRFDEPWDGPHNRQLGDHIGSRTWSSPFRCPSDRDGSPVNTNYVLVTGEGTAWGEGESPQVRDFTDGTSETIMVVEMGDSDIHWMEPRDLTIDQAMRGVNSELGMCISSKHPGIANVLLVDGSVEMLSALLPVDELKKLLTHQGGENAARPKQRSN